MDKYNLEITEKQAQVIKKALEIYARLNMCQFKLVIEDWKMQI